MLRFILFDTTLFSPRDNVKESRTDLVWLLEALVQRNQNYLRQRPETPHLYKSAVVYSAPQQFEGECQEVRTLKAALGSAVKNSEVRRVLDLVQQVLGGERFRDIGRILENGHGDCDNLACWRVAELRQAGIKARPFMTHRPRPDGGTTYHALVLWPPLGNVNYETSEDPSLLLGMGGPSRAAERQEEIRKNAERCDILRKHGIGAGPALDAELEDVLGIRRRGRLTHDVLAEVNKLLRAA